MKKTIRLAAMILAAVMTMAALAGCGGGSSSSSGSADSGAAAKIGFVNEANTDVFDNTRMTALQTLADEVGGYNIEYSDANLDIQKQIDQANTFLSKNVDILMLVPCDSDGIIPAIQNANNKGTPTICFGIKANGGDFIFVESNSYDAGHMQGELMAEMLPENAKVCYLAGTAGLEHSILRRQGFQEALAEAGRDDVEIIEDQDAQYTKAKAKDMSKAQNEYVLEMKGVVKEFPGVRALDGVNLKVRPGKVHVICGENGAGKSTLMKIINGTYVADEGEMIYKGEHVGARSVKDSLDMGIAMIYQELNPVLEMTLAENIWLGREPRNGPFVDFGKMYKDTQDLLDRLEMPYKASQKMYELSIAGHQLIEIAKAISCNASVIIMDEPSSAIGNEEIEVLFKQIFSLREQGVAILYITHKMDEIFRIADEITIIRDGKWIESGPASDYNPQKLVARMVGREITNVFPKDTTVPIGDVILEVIKNGIAMVNEDRRTYGLVLGRDIHENVALVNMKKYTKGLIDDRKISDDVEKMREMLQIKIANEHVEAGTLSGGNQQKVVLAKWLVGDVKVMILDEPTRGIDVGAKSEIHRLMTEFAREGMGIIMISSELPEVLGMSDRIVVMQEGIIFGAIIVGIINNIQTLLGVDSNIQRIVKGAIIVISVIIDVVTKNSAKKAR